MITALIIVSAVAFSELAIIVTLLAFRKLDRQYTTEVKLPDIKWRDDK